MLCLCALAACSSDDDSGAPVGDTTTARRLVRVRYAVSYADLETPGTAEVRYRLPDGNHVDEEVQLPWESRELAFEPEADVSLSAGAPALPTTSLQCDVSTDQGPYGRTSGSSGESSCEVATNLGELGDRS